MEQYEKAGQAIGTALGLGFLGALFCKKPSLQEDNVSNWSYSPS